MKGIWKWVFIFVGVFLVVFLIALPLLGFGGFGPGFGRHMMGLRNGGFGFWGGHGFGFFRGGMMMLGMGLVPLTIVALLVLGVIALVRKNHNEVIPSHPCVNCGKPLQTGWVACPYCGEKQSDKLTSDQDK